MKQARRKSTRHRSSDDGDAYGDVVPKKTKGHSRVGKGGIPQLNPFVEMLKEATVEQAVPRTRLKPFRILTPASASFDAI
jgi:hypothetical protein